MTLDAPLRLVDVLTPGLPPGMLVELLTLYVGSELAQHLKQLHGDAVTAVEKGDFNSHVFIGKQIEAVVQGFSEIEAAGCASGKELSLKT
ncbi:MAG TPA: hypothetical protein VF543_04485 [Pyrinomonadaceae bacterium]